MKLPLRGSTFFLPVIVAVTGAVLMILELTASRTLAPAIGTSLISWTGIIGTVMAWLAVGYTLGGRLADRDSRNHLPELLMLGGFAVLISIVSTRGTITLVPLILNPYVRVVCAASIVFAFPTLVTGMIFPYSMKLCLRSLANSGSVIGTMYTYSTIGSIFGTFFGGFYLLGTFGNMYILLLLSGVLFSLSILLALMYGKRTITLISSCIGLALAGYLWQVPHLVSLPGSIVDLDSRYNRIWIIDKRPTDGSKPIRLLKTGPGAQSSMYLDGDTELSAPYLRFFRTAYRMQPEAKRILMIGGGAYTFPSDAVKRMPNTTIDVVEIDPLLESVAKTYFGFVPNPRIQIINDDARLFIREKIHSADGSPYDIIFIDAYDHAYAIPSHLTTNEFIREMKQVMKPDGSVFVNIISAVSGGKGKFLRAQYWTYKQHFRNVSVYLMDPGIPKDELQNIVLYAGNMRSPDGNYTSVIPKDVPILTDDFAPGEQYLTY